MNNLSIMEIDDDDGMSIEEEPQKPGVAVAAVAVAAAKEIDEKAEPPKVETKGTANAHSNPITEVKLNPNEVKADVKPAVAPPPPVAKVAEPRQTKVQSFVAMAKQGMLADDLVELASTWSPLNSQFSQTKPLPFTPSHKASEYWQAQIANDAADMFKVLLPKKVVLGLCNQLNQHLRRMLSSKISEAEMKRKFYKPEQMYEYFGVKILMGYCKMPDAGDYFNMTLPYRTRIGDLIKEGRFKCIESFTNFNDDMLLALKLHRQTKAEYKERLHYDEDVIPYIMKKVNKVQRRCCNTQQSMTVVRNSFFEVRDPRTNEPITCLYMQDLSTQFIVHMNFQLQGQQDNCIMRMLDAFKQRNHKVYLQRNMISIEQINHLAVCQGTYCHSVVKNPQHAEIKFTRGELMANGTLMVLMLRQKDPSNIMASSADGFHRYNSGDKRSFATVNLQENLKKADVYSQLSDQFRCHFSCLNLSGILFTEVLELITWNSYVAYKNILRKNQNIEFLDFRLLLAKQLLATKIRQLDSTPLPSQPMKTVSIAIQTEKQSSLVQHPPKAPISSFHIPTLLITPASMQINLTCVVCRKPHTQLSQCSNCSEVSGKLVALCPTECFSMFHQQAHLYISNAEELPAIPKENPRSNLAQFESSTLAQSINYSQSLASKYGQMHRQPPQPYQQPGNYMQPPQPYYPPQQPPQYPYGYPQQQYPPQYPQQQPPQQAPMYQQPGRQYSQQQQYDEQQFYQDDEYDEQPAPKKKGRPRGAAPKQVSIQEPPVPAQKAKSKSYYDIQPEQRVAQLQRATSQKAVSYSYVMPTDMEEEQE